MYLVLVRRPGGGVYVYERGIGNREEAEYAASEAMIAHDSKHTVFIEHEMESEYADNIQES